MNPRERMLAAMEGWPVDMVPIAPYFWGYDYAWKLLDVPIWQVVFGPPSNGYDMQEAIIRRHDCDWILPLHHGSGWLEGKEVVREDPEKVLFRDTTTGKEFIYHLEGHWLAEADKVEETIISNEGTNVEPPTTRAEADEWLKHRFPQADSSSIPITPNLDWRERFPDRFFCRCMHPPFASLAYTLGFEPTLIMLHDNPGLCAYMAERLMGNVQAACAQAAADGCDGGLMVDSFASADIMSPECYKNWVAPLHKVTSDELHNAGLKSVMYNTGNLLPLLDTIGSLGYDAISIEERIKGVEMDIADVRKAVGPDQCLFANFDAYLLLNGDRDRIQQEVARQLAAGVVNKSRFIMGTGSPVCDATDPETLNFWINETRKGLA